MDELVAAIIALFLHEVNGLASEVAVDNLEGVSVEENQIVADSQDIANAKGDREAEKLNRKQAVREELLTNFKNLLIAQLSESQLKADQTIILAVISQANLDLPLVCHLHHLLYNLLDEMEGLVSSKEMQQFDDTKFSFYSQHYSVITMFFSELIDIIYNNYLSPLQIVFNEDNLDESSYIKPWYENLQNSNRGLLVFSESKTSVKNPLEHTEKQETFSGYQVTAVAQVSSKGRWGKLGVDMSPFFLSEKIRDLKETLNLQCFLGNLTDELSPESCDGFSGSSGWSDARQKLARKPYANVEYKDIKAAIPVYEAVYDTACESAGFSVFLDIYHQEDKDLCFLDGFSPIKHYFSTLRYQHNGELINFWKCPLGPDDRLGFLKKFKEWFGSDLLNSHEKTVEALSEKINSNSNAQGAIFVALLTRQIAEAINKSFESMLSRQTTSSDSTSSNTNTSQNNSLGIPVMPILNLPGDGNEVPILDLSGIKKQLEIRGALDSNMTGSTGSSDGLSSVPVSARMSRLVMLSRPSTPRISARGQGQGPHLLARQSSAPGGSQAAPSLQFSEGDLLRRTMLLKNQRSSPCASAAGTPFGTPQGSRSNSRCTSPRVIARSAYSSCASTPRTPAQTPRVMPPTVIVVEVPRRDAAGKLIESGDDLEMAEVTLIPLTQRSEDGYDSGAETDWNDESPGSIQLRNVLGSGTNSTSASKNRFALTDEQKRKLKLGGAVFLVLTGTGVAAVFAPPVALAGILELSVLGGVGAGAGGAYIGWRLSEPKVSENTSGLSSDEKLAEKNVGEAGVSVDSPPNSPKESRMSLGNPHKSELLGQSFLAGSVRKSVPPPDTQDAGYETDIEGDSDSPRLARGSFLHRLSSSALTHPLDAHSPRDHHYSTSPRATVTDDTTPPPSMRTSGT